MVGGEAVWWAGRQGGLRGTRPPQLSVVSPPDVTGSTEED